MQQEELKELLAIFDQSTLTEFDLKDGTFELYFNKTAAARSQAGQVNNTGQTQAAEPTVEPTANTQTTTQQTVQSVQAQTTETAKETVAGTDIVSPIVGVVYLRPAPEKEDFKKVGDHVEAGEVVCIVEAMKVMNEITSDVSGEIVEVLVENEQVVEFDQPLFRERRLNMSVMNIQEIKEIIPHRFPMLLIDRIEELEEGERIVAKKKKNVTVNEPFFQGHFPHEPVMPGVLIIEAMAQAGAVSLLSLEQFRGKTAYFGGIDKAKFRKKVTPAIH